MLSDNSEPKKTIGEVPCTQPLLVQPAGLQIALRKKSWVEPTGSIYKSQPFLWLNEQENKFRGILF